MRRRASGLTQEPPAAPTVPPPPVDPVQAAKIQADAIVRAAEIKAQAKLLVAESEARLVREQLQVAREQLQRYQEARKEPQGTRAFLRALALGVGEPRAHKSDDRSGAGKLYDARPLSRRHIDNNVPLTR